MFSTAWRTPLPRYRDLSASRSSSASCSPVDAPEGTAARPSVPSSRITSASTVGLPRESMTWRPITPAILWVLALPGLLVLAALPAFVALLRFGLAFLLALVLLGMLPPGKLRDGILTFAPQCAKSAKSPRDSNERTTDSEGFFGFASRQKS